MRRRPISAWLGSILAIALCLGLKATTLQRLALDDMIQGSTDVVRAKVKGSTSVLRHGDVFTVYQLSVLEQWKHQAGRIAPQEVAVPGGVAGGVRQQVGGAPVLRPGQEYILFLWQGKSGLTQLMGLSQGVFGVIGERTVQAPATDQMLDRAGHTVMPEALSLKLSVLKARVGGVY